MYEMLNNLLDSFILKNSSLTIPRTLEVEMAIDPKTKDWLINNNIHLLTFDDI